MKQGPVWQVTGWFWYTYICLIFIKLCKHNIWYKATISYQGENCHKWSISMIKLYRNNNMWFADCTKLMRKYFLFRISWYKGFRLGFRYNDSIFPWWVIDTFLHAFYIHSICKNLILIHISLLAPHWNRYNICYCQPWPDAFDKYICCCCFTISFLGIVIALIVASAIIISIGIIITGIICIKR